MEIHALLMANSRVVILQGLVPPFLILSQKLVLFSFSLPPLSLPIPPPPPSPSASHSSLATSPTTSCYPSLFFPSFPLFPTSYFFPISSCFPLLLPLPSLLLTTHKGTFHYFCGPHCSSGMTGTIVVNSKRQKWGEMSGTRDT